MTKDEIILMADASGLSYYGMGKDRDKFLHYLEAFADLVAAAEREACAKLRDTLHPFDLHSRSEMLGVMNQGLDDYQNLIRARGNT